MYDTVIIGAGMSGLAAGIRLAHFGRPVCILERHTTIGGLNSFYRLEGRNYDVGLHAVTNFASHNARRGPLRRVLRQLRIPWDAFDVAPQIGSAIAFPGVMLRFGNDIDELRSAVAAAFPGERANFDRLLGELADYDELESAAPQRSARGVVGSILGDPLLIDMLFCPLMYYGSAAEHDMDFAQFSIMFRSIFLEGLGRPWAGVRQIVKTSGAYVQGVGRRAAAAKWRAAAPRRAWQGRSDRPGRRSPDRRAAGPVVGGLGRNDAAV